ncbi:MAG TPA: RNA polymerase sigma-70 factor [Candidatus Parabacteroides intestinigallinarum]|uniref:RNA polymerase sigma-70 factor n=1 Tax=Candidatus Parabacteroides intestinigallinarum TaxID=2838722 RepID=A0A9D1XQG2_9BACT|nr:RNA polymerase sigma-70 factor [Candidatus Parabacteroides intestinigallinarum]
MRRLFVGAVENDEELLRSLRSDSEEAFTCVYERYHRLLYVLAYRYLKDTAFAEDATQHVFMRLWESRALLVAGMNLRNFLYTMMKNHVLNVIRDQNTAIEKNYEIAQSAPEYEDELLAKIEEKDMMRRLYEEIDRLPEQKRLVCLYKLRGNLSNQEIAERMRISVPTVKTHYAQAIKALRIRFEKLFLILLCLWGSSCG